MAKSRGIQGKVPDFGVFFAVLVLLGIGIIAVFSASQYFAQYAPYNDSLHFLKRQSINALIGIVGMLFAMKIDYRWFQVLALPGLVISILMLVVVLALGGTRWISLGFIQFQPSEIAKVAIIVFMALILSRDPERLQSFTHGFLPCLGLMGLVCGLVVIKDLSTSIVIAGTCCVMMFCSGAKWSHMGFMFALGIVAFIAAVWVEPYRMARIFAFLDPWSDPQGDGFQTIQSYLAIGSGGLTGVGLGAGSAKWYYLPERHTDFIFSIWAEEMGFLGGTIIILTFLFFVWRGFMVSLNLKNNFQSLLALGITSMIGIQALINLCVVVGLFPVTGVTLPFISYGGTSLAISLTSVGILLNVSRYAKTTGD